MKKSWLSIFLPEDEYKEKRILYFLGEAAIIGICVSLLFLIASYIYPLRLINTSLFFSFVVVGQVIYIFLRYIFAGMEYTNTFSSNDYKREMKKIFFQSLTFMFVFFAFYVLISGLPQKQPEWRNMICLPILSSFLMFLMNFISLKSSYRKNNG
ncbi:hypothetical protein [Priestia filamentosa]|uniref:hypothetical protein n=1 Tax=Priestia filamentosa TaxID=1402861 RepID=UPI000A0888ED|nr:hypothetical protein [Priestia filamentosa]MDT3762811.1 DUF3278 domain-containing protein [Priestia filamentosa]OXS69347.1 hypothetical protein B1B01_10255 [Priestia filamentosa]WRU97263.1 DUF3278 domain-containing protein [Priestia filamentosa]SMF31623.1 hypothetical protein SAMN06296056_102619 [Priestia filamentosa]